MRPLDSAMFGKDWWLQPLAARHASIDAAEAGLVVTVEMVKTSGYYKEIPCIVWRGTAEKFSHTNTFPEGVNAKRASGKYVTPGQLRGTVYPEQFGKFAFVIECVYNRGRNDIKRLAAKAINDEHYLNFRSRIMSGYPLASIGDIET